MPTVAHIVESLIRKKPFLQEALCRGIINNAALAEQFRPVIEEMLQKPVKFSAVNIALRRSAEKMKGQSLEQAMFDQESSVVVQSSLVAIIVFKQGIQKELVNLYSIVEYKKGDFLTITHGLHEVMIITNQKHKHAMLKMFRRTSIKKIISQLSALTINIPEQSIHTVGLFYLVTKALNWENINIIDIVSTYTEMTFILDEKKTAQAYDVVGKLLEEHTTP